MVHEKKISAVMAIHDLNLASRFSRGSILYIHSIQGIKARSFAQWSSMLNPESKEHSPGPKAYSWIDLTQTLGLESSSFGYLIILKVAIDAPYIIWAHFNSNIINKFIT
jgi:hypothetical protein